MSGGVTTNYGLKKPNFNVRPWDSDVNGNFDLIDTLLYTLFQIPNIAGGWKNSTQYTAGQNVLDPQSLVFYNCLVTHVSAASGTFAADRLANPTYWTLTQPQIGSVRYDQGQALTAPQIQQALTNLSTLSTAQMVAKFLQYDGAQTLSASQMAQVLTNSGLIAGLLSLSASQFDYLRANVLSGTATLNLASATTLQTTDIDKPVNVTGVTTITMPAAANSWRSGVIKNANTGTGLVTLAVPTGASLDGVTNGTLLLFPYQRVRILQTGTTAYTSDWVDRAPIVAMVPPLTTAVATIDVVLPDNYSKFRLTGAGFQLGAAGIIGFRGSLSDAASIKSGASDYASLGSGSDGTSALFANSGATNFAYLTTSVQANSSIPATFETILYPGTATLAANAITKAAYRNATPAAVQFVITSLATFVGRLALLRLLNTSGNNFSVGATLTVEGIP